MALTNTNVEAVIVLRFIDGTVGRMQFFDWPVDELIQVAIDKTSWGHLGKPIAWRRGAFSDFPVEHHEFRSAWRDTGAKVEVDMPTARNLWRDKLRAARKPLLAALDEQVQRALETPGTDMREIVAAKQALRDVTDDPAIEAATTPDELKAVWPAPLLAKI